jgi:hypothetical protein
MCFSDLTDLSIENTFFQIAAVASLIPQCYIIVIIVENKLNVPVLKWNATIIIIVTVS